MQCCHNVCNIKARALDVSSKYLPSAKVKLLEIVSATNDIIPLLLHYSFNYNVDCTFIKQSLRIAFKYTHQHCSSLESTKTSMNVPVKCGLCWGSLSQQRLMMPSSCCSWGVDWGICVSEGLRPPMMSASSAEGFMQFQKGNAPVRICHIVIANAYTSILRLGWQSGSDRTSGGRKYGVPPLSLSSLSRPYILVLTNCRIFDSPKSVSCKVTTKRKE